MGKIRTARRRPSVTASDLRYTGVGGEVIHEGDPFVIEGAYGEGNSKVWILTSAQGVEYSATVDEYGRVSMGVTGRVLCNG